MAFLSYLTGAIGFVAYAILFMLLLRLRLRLGWFLLELILGFVVHILSSVIGAAWISGFVYWYGLALYAFLWFCFFFVTSIYSVSVTVGIIRYLFNKQDHSASIDEIYESCILAPFKERADFLVMTGQAQRVEAGYISTPAGRKTVERMQWIGDFLGMENKAFYQTPERGSIDNKRSDAHLKD